MFVKKSPFKRWSFRSKDGVLTQNSMFFQKFRTFKNSPFKRRSFNTKFHVFQKIPYIQKFPVRKKVYTFEKVDFFNKIRFVNINIWISPILYCTFYHSLPYLTSKNLQKQAFKRTISMFDINYPDQKVLCITNLIPVGRLRTKFGTF